MKKVLCAVIPADMDAEVGHMEFYAGDLSAMHGLVGGLVEAIDLNEYRATMWANEESKNLGLPINARASMFLWLSDPRWRFRDHIRGDVFITGLPDEEGDTQSMPMELFQLLFRTAKYRTEVQTGGEEWSGNRICFEEYFEAAHAVLDLATRWRLVTHCRVVAA